MLMPMDMSYMAMLMMLRMLMPMDQLGHGCSGLFAVM